MPRLRKYDEAIVEYKKAFELSPDNHRVAMLLVALYLGKEDYDAAAGLMENLIKTNTESIIGYYYLGKIEAGRKHLDKAIEYYNKAIEINPSFQSAYAK